MRAMERLKKHSGGDPAKVVKDLERLDGDFAAYCKEAGVRRDLVGTVTKICEGAAAHRKST